MRWASNQPARKIMVENVVKYYSSVITKPFSEYANGMIPPCEQLIFDAIDLSLNF